MRHEDVRVGDYVRVLTGDRKDCGAIVTGVYPINITVKYEGTSYTESFPASELELLSGNSTNSIKYSNILSEMGNYYEV